jgi:hypothetical protein
MTFQGIKANLDKFDRSILEQWQSRVEIDQDSNFYSYVVGVPDFPAESAALKPAPNAISLYDMAQIADLAGESDITISMQTLRSRFCFPAGPVERPRVVVKKPKKSHKEKKEKEKKKNPAPPSTARRAPGQPPRLESAMPRTPRKK